tara:strand:- start:786 stop:1607 length:822 start_codon:yes stop_codon:yes gene_type:complete
MVSKDILIVTATLGDRDTLERTVNSIKTVSTDRVAHIIVCPLDKVSIIQEKYIDLTVISEPPGCKGIYAALNHGLLPLASDYSYLGFINDDDFWLESFIDLIDVLDCNSNVDIAYGKVGYFNSSGNFLFPQSSSNQYRWFKKLLAFDVVLFTQQASLMRSSVFLKLGGFSEDYKLISDSDFWIRAISNKFVFKYINKVCAGYTIQKGQLTSNKELSDVEHLKLNIAHNIKKDFSGFIHLSFYRIINIPNYISRILNNNNSRMTDYFHLNNNIK